MKVLNIRWIALTALTFFAGLLLLLAGCMKHSPVAPDDTLLSHGNELHFIPIGKGNPALMKVIRVSQLVTREDGGKLVLKFKAPDKKEPVEVKLVLKVLPESISEDTELSLSIDDEKLIANVDITFAPHGITFSKPALLSIDAKRLDLSNTDEGHYDFYYYNPDTGLWERIETKKIKVNLNKGEIEVKDARIPHFSRYAVAWSR
ncbi:MAG: hypothetical protein ACE5HI_20475 [bacterium]